MVLADANDAPASRVEFEIGEIYRTQVGEMDSARVYYSRVAAREGRDPLLPRALMRLGDVEVRDDRMIRRGDGPDTSAPTGTDDCDVQF